MSSILCLIFCFKVFLHTNLKKTCPFIVYLFVYLLISASPSVYSKFLISANCEYDKSQGNDSSIFCPGYSDAIATPYPGTKESKLQDMADVFCAHCAAEDQTCSQLFCAPNRMIVSVAMAMMSSFCDSIQNTFSTCYSEFCTTSVRKREALPQEGKIGSGEFVCKSTSDWSAVPGMDQWCQSNCKSGNDPSTCPESYCQCSELEETSVPVNSLHSSCIKWGASLAWSIVKGIDSWCHTSCSLGGDCPESHCQCIESSPELTTTTTSTTDSIRTASIVSSTSTSSVTTATTYLTNTQSSPSSTKTKPTTSSTSQTSPTTSTSTTRATTSTSTTTATTSASTSSTTPTAITSSTSITTSSASKSSPTTSTTITSPTKSSLSSLITSSAYKSSTSTSTSTSTPSLSTTTSTTRTTTTSHSSRSPTSAFTSTTSATTSASTKSAQTSTSTISTSTVSTSESKSTSSPTTSTTTTSTSASTSTTSPTASTSTQTATSSTSVTTSTSSSTSTTLSKTTSTTPPTASSVSTRIATSSPSTSTTLPSTSPTKSISTTSRTISISTTSPTTSTSTQSATTSSTSKTTTSSSSSTFTALPSSPTTSTSTQSSTTISTSRTTSASLSSPSITPTISTSTSTTSYSSSMGTTEVTVSTSAIIIANLTDTDSQNVVSQIVCDHAESLDQNLLTDRYCAQQATPVHGGYSFGILDQVLSFAPKILCALTNTDGRSDTCPNMFCGETPLSRKLIKSSLCSVCQQFSDKLTPSCATAYCS